MNIYTHEYILGIGLGKYVILRVLVTLGFKCTVTVEGFLYCTLIEIYRVEGVAEATSREFEKLDRIETNKGFQEVEQEEFI